jgi:hypothetical protein
MEFTVYYRTEGYPDNRAWQQDVVYIPLTFGSDFRDMDGKW